MNQPENNNTATSFSDKWHRNPNHILEQTLDESSDIAKWILSRNGFESLAVFGDHLKGKKRILDGGCGNGRVTALLRSVTDPEITEVVGIDLVAADVARSNFHDAPNTRFEQADLLGNLTNLGYFDFIYCQEVLHHTSNPRKAFLNLSKLLGPGGELAIYVYKKKAPIREHADDFIRQMISHLPYEESMKACEQITELGKALDNIEGEIEIPEVNILEIPAGKYTYQRFIYHFFMKCFWSEQLNYNENVVVNYDWYHPQSCSRHTAEEIREWFNEANLKIEHFCEDFYGITVRGLINS